MPVSQPAAALLRHRFVRRTLRLLLAVGLLALVACSSRTQQVRLNVQRLCGRPVSSEVAYIPVDLSKPRDVTLPAVQPVLLVFDPRCRGVTVTPAPSMKLELARRPPGIVTEIKGADGLIAGIYGSAAQQVFRLHVTPPTGAAYDVTLRFGD